MKRFALVMPSPQGNVNRKNNLFDWEMVGKNAQNHNSISRFNLLNPVSMQWNQNTNSEFDRDNILFSRGLMVFHSERYIHCISNTSMVVKNGVIEFGELLKKMVVHQDRLFVIHDDSDTEFLTIDLVTGQLCQKKIQSTSSRVSNPVFYQNKLIIIDDGALVAFEPKSGEIIWKNNENLNPEFYPVLNTNHVFAVRNQNELVVLILRMVSNLMGLTLMIRLNLLL